MLHIEKKYFKTIQEALSLNNTIPTLK